jgi:predicted component of type VI protein secretion system
MQARLVPMNPGLSRAPTIPVQRPVLLVGRHPECDVRIDQSKISRRHCCLALVYDRVVIRDLGSRNGVRVNGRIVDEAQLHPGDEVAIGPLLFRVEDLDAVAPQVQLPAPAGAVAALGSPPKTTPATRPPSLPSLPSDPNDPEGDLFPLDL